MILDNKTLVDRLIEWFNELNTKGDVNFLSVNEEDKVINAFINRAIISIYFKKNRDYVEYKITTYDKFQRWLSNTFLSSDRIEYENNDVKLEFTQKNTNEDWSLCTMFSDTKQFIEQVIQEAKDGDLDFFLRKFVEYHVDLT